MIQKPAMTILHIDIETYSECDLKAAGVYRFAEHLSTEIMACAYAFDNGKLNLWIPYAKVPSEILGTLRTRFPDAFISYAAECPASIREHILAKREIRAHNAQFERVVIHGVAGKKLGIPPIAIEQTTCTAAKMSAAGLPRGLDDAARALGLPGKDDQGRMAMLQLCKPRKPTKDDPSIRYSMEKYPDKWIDMFAYNLPDVALERAIDDAVPDLVPSEQQMYHLDQRINQRGWKVDVASVENILFTIEQYRSLLAAEFLTLTEDWKGDGLKPSQREKVADWVREQGVHILDMQAETIIDMIARGGLPCNVERVLRIYSTYNAKSIAKYQAMLDAVCADGRLRGMFLFLGAATGRWSSLIVQLQNLMRPVIKDVDQALEAFSHRDIELIRFLWPDIDPIKVAGSCVRSVLVADEGKDLMYPDFSGVEDRANSWIFGEQWVLEAYRGYDRKEGPHPYVRTASQIFGIRIEDVTDDLRQIGKVTRLALGYEGGVGAFLAMVDTYGIDLQQMTDAVLPKLSEEARSHGEWMWENHRVMGVTHDQSVACDGVKYLYRQDHPNIKQGWKDLKTAAEQAVQFPGKAFAIAGGKIAFKVCEYKGRSWLHMRLPSGRHIMYFAPAWKPSYLTQKVVNGEIKEVLVPGELRYMGVHPKTHQFVELSTYGGELDNNADQGFCSDLQRNAMRKLEAAGYQVIGGVHDQVITEQPVGYGSFEEVAFLMCDQPEYAAGLPLAVEGKRKWRFGK